MAGQLIERGQGTERGKLNWLIRIFVGRDPQTGKREYHNEPVYNASKKEAEQALRDALSARKNGKITMGSEKRLIGELLDDLLRDYRINGQSIDWAEIVVNIHLRPVFGDIPISKFTSTHRDNYIAARLAKGRKNATINRELSLLRRAFTLGSEHEPPKVHTVPRIPMLEEDNVRQGFFEHADYLALLKTLPDELHPVLTYAYFTGCRKSEILALRWDQVDLLERVVRLEPGTTKNKLGRMIPLAPPLYEALKMQKSIRDQYHPACPWVFHRDGERILDFKGSWETACKAAGLWNTEGEKPKPSKLFHDLRRSGVRNLSRAGVPDPVVMRISGHKTRSVFDRYNITSEDDLKIAAEKLGRYIEVKSNELAQQAEAEKDTRVATAPAPTLQ